MKEKNGIRKADTRNYRGISLEQMLNMEILVIHNKILQRQEQDTALVMFSIQ